MDDTTKKDDTQQPADDQNSKPVRAAEEAAAPAPSDDSPTTEPQVETEAEPEVSETETELEQDSATVEPVAEEAVPEPSAQPEPVTEEPSKAQPETPLESPSTQTAQDENTETTESTGTADLAKDEQVFEEDGETKTEEVVDTVDIPDAADPNDPGNIGKWYVVHTYSGHENRVATALKQRIESEHLEHKIFDLLVPTQDKIEIRGGKKEQVKEKIFPGYILVKMDLDDASWLAVRTTQGVTSFVGIGNKPTPISDREVRGIRKFMTQGAASTFKDIFAINDTVKIIDGPFSDFIGKVDAVDKEKGKVRVLVSIFGRETPVELDFLQVQKL